MSDLMVKVLTGVLRVVMAPILTWLISKNIISSDESVKLVAEVFAYLVPSAWTVLAWIRQHRTQMTALAMPKGSTPADLLAQMATGYTAPALTPVDSAPHINS